MDENKIYRRIIDILRKAGYSIGGHEDILVALSDYEEKHDAMLEHLLMQKGT